MMLDTLKTLLAVWGPTGQEGQVAQELQQMLADKADAMRVDVMGNLIVEKKGQPGGKTLMFSAHMDHIGLVVTDIEDTGYLRVTNVGGVSVDSMRCRHVAFGNGVQGVAVCQPTKGETAGMQHLFVDIGAQDRAEALTMVQLGDVCVFAPDCFPVGPHRFASPAMDDRCACALLAELLLQTDAPRNTVVGVFSVQEEVGLRGAATAAYQVAPDIGVAIDVTAWGDTPEVKLPAVKLGAGAAIKFMDRSMIATPCVRDALMAAAEKAGVPYQREILPFGGTDGGAIQHSRGGVPTGTLSIPCRYVHSACETIDMRDMESGLAILKEFVNGEY
ncbi:MAG: M42 family metallopeptidase [Clostridia bacterium]|nr:M42 family metallopeptidase [Clostridia bacterium]